MASSISDEKHNYDKKLPSFYTPKHIASKINFLSIGNKIYSGTVKLHVNKRNCSTIINFSSQRAFSS